MINPLECFFGIEGHVALDINPGPGYNTLLLRLISGYLLSAGPHIDRTTHYPTLYTVRIHSQTLTLMHACQAGMQFQPFYGGLWYDLAGTQTHDIPHERRAR